MCAMRLAFCWESAAYVAVCTRGTTVGTGVVVDYFRALGSFTGVFRGWPRRHKQEAMPDAAAAFLVHLVFDFRGPASCRSCRSVGNGTGLAISDRPGFARGHCARPVGGVAAEAGLHRSRVAVLLVRECLESPLLGGAPALVMLIVTENVGSRQIFHLATAIAMHGGLSRRLRRCNRYWRAGPCGCRRRWC
jgi:hypothetical protein